MSLKAALTLLAAISFCSLTAGCASTDSNRDTVRKPSATDQVQPSAKGINETSNNDTSSGMTFDASDEPADDIEPTSTTQLKYENQSHHSPLADPTKSPATDSTWDDGK